MQKIFPFPYVSVICLLHVWLHVQSWIKICVVSFFNPEHPRIPVNTAAPHQPEETVPQAAGTGRTSAQDQSSRVQQQEDGQAVAGSGLHRAAVSAVPGHVRRQKHGRIHKPLRGMCQAVTSGGLISLGMHYRSVGGPSWRLRYVCWCWTESRCRERVRSAVRFGGFYVSAKVNWPFTPRLESIDVSDFHRLPFFGTYPRNPCLEDVEKWFSTQSWESSPCFSSLRTWTSLLEALKHLGWFENHWFHAHGW